jgi:hypothetical protein
VQIGKRLGQPLRSDLVTTSYPRAFQQFVWKSPRAFGLVTESPQLNDAPDSSISMFRRIDVLPSMIGKMMLQALLEGAAAFGFADVATDAYHQATGLDVTAPDREHHFRVCRLALRWGGGNDLECGVLMPGHVGGDSPHISQC